MPILFTTPSLIFSTVSSKTKFINGSKPRSTPATCLLAFNFTVKNKYIIKHIRIIVAFLIRLTIYIVIFCPNICKKKRKNINNIFVL